MDNLRKMSIYNTGNKSIIPIKLSDLIKLNLQIPNIQRIKDSVKVSEIVGYQLGYYKDNNSWNYLSLINLHYCVDTEIYYIMDGQHRYESLKILYNEHSHDIEILIEIIKVGTYSDIRHNYELINKNTPLPDLPEHIDKTIPERVAQFFNDKYSQMNSQKPRANRPNIYFNHFQEGIGVMADKLSMYIKNEAEMKQHIVAYNDKISKRGRDTFPDAKHITDRMWDKCNKSGMFMGLYKYTADEYCYKWVKDIIREITGKTVKIVIKSGKKRIPKKIKTESWDYWIGKDKRNGVCKCCNITKLDITNFTAGHIISESNGGKVTVDNLAPVCSGCNSSMATTNMPQYMAEHYPGVTLQPHIELKPATNSSMFNIFSSSS